MNKRNTIKQLLHRRCLLMGICAITSSAFAWDFAEHRKIGDRAMSLLPRYLVENGIFPNEAVADSALLQILNMSHMPGSNAYAMNELTQLPNIVTYGEELVHGLCLQSQRTVRLGEMGLQACLQEHGIFHMVAGQSAKRENTGKFIKNSGRILPPISKSMRKRDY